MKISREAFDAFFKEQKPHVDLNRDDLYSSGAIDSFDILSLLTAAAEKFRLDLDIAEMTPEIFESVDRIYCFLNRGNEG